jgi:hypothetical protein
VSGPPAPPTLADPGPDPDRSTRSAGLDACSHGPGGGYLDESARRLTHPELAVARLLVAEGHRVYAVPEWPRLGPVADLRVCDVAVEVKSFLAVDDLPGRRVPSAKSVFNKLMDAGRQAGIAVIYGQGSGLSRRVAGEGVALFAARRERPALAQARIVGDGFDVSWSGPQLSRIRTMSPLAADLVAAPSTVRHGMGVAGGRGLGFG